MSSKRCYINNPTSYDCLCAVLPSRVPLHTGSVQGKYLALLSSERPDIPTSDNERVHHHEAEAAYDEYETFLR